MVPMSDKEETTSFENKCKILGELWLDYRHDSEFVEFVSQNNLGVPLAFMVSENFVTPNIKAIEIIEETFALLLDTIDIMDSGFETLEDLMVG
jgi:hypothetical protein